MRATFRMDMGSLLVELVAVARHDLDDVNGRLAQHLHPDDLARPFLHSAR